MNIEQRKTDTGRDDDSLKRSDKDLTSFWAGADSNLECFLQNGKDGRLEKLWISARSEGNKERFVFCNQDPHFDRIPSRTIEELSHIFADIIAKKRTLTDAIADIGRSIESADWVDFWIAGVGEDMFTLPAGLSTMEPRALMPTFQEVCKDPALGKNLFAVLSPQGEVGIFINEAENFSLIKVGDSLYQIPGTDMSPKELRQFTFAKSNLLVDGSDAVFAETMAQFKVGLTWTEAGGPSARFATSHESGARVGWSFI